MIFRQNHHSIHHTRRQWLSRTISTIAELQPGANVVEQGLSISRNSVTDAQSDVENWVAGLGF